MHPILNGLFFGLIFIFSFGPAFFSLIQTSVQKGFKRAIFLAIGISLSDVCFASLALMGVSSLLEDPKIKLWIGLIGSIVLLAYGLYNWFKKVENIEKTKVIAQEIITKWKLNDKIEMIATKMKRFGFNDKVEELDIKLINQYKFNGCGLVISSDLIKSGVNIPKSSFFIHEDTAFMLQLQQMFQGNIPQYVIKNVLLVHNRKHTKKRSYIEGELKSDDVSGGRLRHDWYKKASDMSHHNCYNMFNQSKTYTWKDVFDG